MAKIIVDEMPRYEDECPFSYIFGIDNDTEAEVYRCFIAQLKERPENMFCNYKNCKYLTDKKNNQCFCKSKENTIRPLKFYDGTTSFIDFFNNISLENI